MAARIATGMIINGDTRRVFNGMSVIAHEDDNGVLSQSHRFNLVD